MNNSRWSLLALLLVALLALPAAATAGSLTGIRIFLDPGHGGQAGQSYSGSPGDPGAIGPTGLREADCVLAIANRVKQQLEAQGATVNMSRSSDVFVSLSGRTAMANALGADRLVSIHQNANANPAPNYTGTHVYTSASANSLDMAAKTVIELDRYHNIGVVSTNCGIRGVRQDNFHMVRESAMPAQLVENTFISNAAEETRLRQASHLQASGDAIFRGLMAHLGKTVVTDVNPPTVAHTQKTAASEGSAIAIEATVTDAAGVESVVLYYRTKGSSSWIAAAMTKQLGEIYSATIPAAAATPAGVEYYLATKDKAGNSGKQPASAPAIPYAISVTAVPHTGNLTGVLTDKATGARLAGVSVTATPGGAVAISSATGVYLFNNLNAGSYTLVGRLPGYLDGNATATVETGLTRWGSFTLARTPQTAVSGIVKDSNGRALGGVSIRIGTVTVVSAGDGSFSAGPFNYGAYTLTATLAGYTPTSKNLTVGANTPAQTIIIKSTTAQISGTVNVPGTITLVQTGQTVSGQSFSFADLAPGRYQLKVAADAHRSQSRTLTVTAGQAREANFFLIAIDKGILRVKVKQVNASGRVVNGQGVAVTISGPITMTRPTGWGGVSGEALFDELPPGVYTVTAGNLRQTVTIVKAKTLSIVLGP